MTFAIITHVDHFIEDERYYGYAPYVKEMNIWCKFIDKLIIIAPVSNKKRSAIHTDYSFNNITFIRIPAISITSFVESIRAIYFFPVIAFRIFRVMQKADHIHLRCPGNIGLIGCMVQILFPRKPKTAKYAGNWDPKSKQPSSYRIQKWMLSNTFLTKNMKVLVYGDWPDQSTNVKPFFTASYAKDKIEPMRHKEFKTPYKFIFVGSLSSGKCPLYALRLINKLNLEGIECRLELFGDGNERTKLENYIIDSKLTQLIKLSGNQTSKRVEVAYKESDFLILPSKSEGWPKVVAEAMFWGVIPMVTKISCVPWMLDNGNRGVLLEANLIEDFETILKLMDRPEALACMSEAAQQWSQKYTLDDFSAEISKLIQ